MNKLVLPCRIKNRDYLIVDEEVDGLIISIEEYYMDSCFNIYLSKDSAQQLADYLTAWLDLSCTVVDFGDAINELRRALKARAKK